MSLIGESRTVALVATLLTGSLASTAHAQQSASSAEDAEPTVVSSEAAPAASDRGVRVRAGLTAGAAVGGAEARQEGGFMIAGTVHARIGLQITDLVGLYYEAAGYFGGWPRSCERGGWNCSDYGMVLHSSAGLLELTFDWFQVAAGGGFIGGIVAGHPTSGLAARGRIAYVDGWQRPDRAGFTIGAELMAAALFDGCWAHTTEVTVGYEWY